MLSKKVVCVVAYDNRLPITTDVSQQVLLAMQALGWGCPGVSTTILVPATMTAPLAGSNQIIVDLLVPTGTLDATIANAVAFAITILDLPFCPTIVVNNTTVYTTAAAPTPGPPIAGARPTNGNP